MLKNTLVFLVLTVVLFGGLYVLKDRHKAAMEADLANPPPPATVATVEVGSERWRSQLRSVGSLVANNGIDVSAEVGGIVHKIAFESGQSVAAGDVLVYLDAEVDQARLKALRADRRLAQVEYERQQSLLKKQVGSKSDYDTAAAAYQAAAARVTEQEAIVARKTLTAPFAGLLGIRLIDLGEYLTPGQGIVSLQALDPIYVDYTLPERHYRELRVGQTVEVHLDALPEQSFQGAIVALEAAVLESSRSVKVRAELPNPQGLLRPGMFADVRTLADAERTVLTLPQTAIVYASYGDSVLLIAPADGGALRTRRQQVSTGAVRNGKVEIVSGLRAGDQVVRAGQSKVFPGMPIVIDNSVELDDAEVSAR